MTWSEAKSVSRVQLFATPWTVGSSVRGIFQARILEWVSISFSRGFSQPKNWIPVSSIVGRRFTVWATREVLLGKCVEISISYLFRCVLSRFSCVQLSVTLWTVACQASLSMGFSRQEYWSGLPCSPPGNLPDLEIRPTFLMSPALANRLFTTSVTWEAPYLSKPPSFSYLSKPSCCFFSCYCWSVWAFMTFVWINCNNFLVSCSLFLFILLQNVADFGVQLIHWVNNIKPSSSNPVHLHSTLAKCEQLYLWACWSDTPN